MPGEAPEKATSAGISSEGGVDVALLFARLKDEVRRHEPTRVGGGASVPVESGARAQAERVWPITFDQPVHRRPGWRGRLEHPVKRTVRRLVRWYVEPVALDQRTFNEAALKLVDELHERVDAALRELRRVDGRVDDAQHGFERLGRLATELEQRLTRVERRDTSAPATVAAQPRAAAVPDYFAFEARMRGDTETIRERQRPYVDDFRERAPVLDIGCGRGEFLQLLRAAGIEGRGVDADADMVAFARGEGLDVEQADVLAYLDGLPDASLGGIFAAQLVEHLPPSHLLRLLELAHAKLRPGGLLVAETINPLAPLALRDYFADLTHAQPLVPETLELLARQAGFGDVAIRFVNEPPPEERLQPVALPTGADFDPARAALGHNVARLNEQLFGPRDYAVVATR